MRWERLFADLEAAEAARERQAAFGEAAERARLETARVTLESRLLAGVGSRVSLDTAQRRCVGVLVAVGSGWLAVESPTQNWIVATAHLISATDLPIAAAPAPEGARRQIYESLDLRHVIRGVAADRSAIQIGVGLDEPIYGTIDRVGADFVDVAVHPVGEPRRAREVRGRRTVALAAVHYLVREL